MAHVEVLRRVDSGAGWACLTSLPVLSFCIMRMIPAFPHCPHTLVRMRCKELCGALLRTPLRRLAGGGCALRPTAGIQCGEGFRGGESSLAGVTTEGWVLTRELEFRMGKGCSGGWSSVDKCSQGWGAEKSVATVQGVHL